MGGSVIRLERLANLVGRGLGGMLGKTFNRVQREKPRSLFADSPARYRGATEGSKLSPSLEWWTIQGYLAHKKQHLPLGPP